jgi:hypothetical protein
MPLIQALHGLTKSTKNNATPRVSPYGVVSHTKLHSIVIHSIGVYMKIKSFKNGYATLEKLFPSGMYLVQCYIGTELHDKIRCDDYQIAMQYYKAFSNIAKNS